MKNRRLVLPASLLLIALISILFFTLFTQDSTIPVQGESMDDDSAATNAADSSSTEDPQDSVPESTIDDTVVSESASSTPVPSKSEFFSDALFIGDSRTVGLQDYAELDTATYFAYSGLSSFSAFKKTLDVEGIGKTSLEELLNTRHYDKIYLMLGINELGYPLASICSQYTHVANRLHELHPHARIILCANLRVVADGKEKRDYIANETINQVNEHIASLTDNETFFYVDVNPLFDDGNGALDPKYCADDIHPYGKYYYQWAQWLYEIGIQHLP